MNGINKSILIFSILILFPAFAFSADDKDKNGWGENSDVFSQGFSSQEQISDTKMNKTIEMLKERALTRKQRKIRNEVQPISPAYDENHLDKFAQEDPTVNELKKSRTVMIPMNAFDENGTMIQPGYYKLSCRQISKNEYVLDLSQGNTLVTSVKALQTKQDLDQEEINFCNSEIISDNRIRLMFGSIDLNLVGYIYFK